MTLPTSQLPEEMYQKMLHTSFPGLNNPDVPDSIKTNVKKQYRRKEYKVLNEIWTSARKAGIEEERTKIYKHLCSIWDKNEVPTMEWRESLKPKEENE